MHFACWAVLRLGRRFHWLICAPASAGEHNTSNRTWTSGHCCSLAVQVPVSKPPVCSSPLLRWPTDHPAMAVEDHLSAAAQEDSVVVAVNVRPLIDLELAEGCKPCLHVTPGEPQVGPWAWQAGGRRLLLSGRARRHPTGAAAAAADTGPGRLLACPDAAFLVIATLYYAGRAWRPPVPLRPCLWRRLWGGARGGAVRPLRGAPRGRPAQGLQCHSACLRPDRQRQDVHNG